MSEAVLSSPAGTKPSASIPLPLMVGTFVVLWASAFAVGKIALADCPPFLFLAARFLAAGVLMIGLAAVTGIRWTLSKRDVLVFAVLGVACLPLRTSSGRPTASSSRLICWLTVDWVR